jgi:hypothetical protein
MHPTKMNAVLAEMKPHEIRDALRFIDVFERAGDLQSDEAAELRRRVVGWQAFYSLDQTTIQ